MKRILLIAFIVVQIILIIQIQINVQQDKRINIHTKQINCLEVDMVYVFGDYCAKVDEHGFIIRDN